MSSAVTVEGLQKAYGKVEAVRGVSFEIEVGEVFGLLGPNGAGKTTTVEILEGYRDRDAGLVEVLGADPATAGADWRQRIGVVLQSGSLYAQLTVVEILRLFAGYYERPRDLDEVIGIVGLEEKRRERVHTLSGGQKRRLDFGLALVGDPELVFLDEPTTGFDPEARRRAGETIRSLRDLGKTILLTTHYLDEAERLCDRVAVLRDGEIAALGRPGRAHGSPAADRDPLPGERRRGRRPHGGADPRAERADGRGATERRRARSARGAATQSRGRVSLADAGAHRMRLLVHELRGELLLYIRSRELAFFTFLLPIIFLVILGYAYGDEEIDGHLGADYLVSGMIGYGVASTAFAGLAIVLVIRREEGILKRLRATPLPAFTYIAAVLGTTLIAFLVSTVCIVALSMTLLDGNFPKSPVSLAAALLLGGASFAAIGVGASTFVHRAEGVSAAVNAIYIPLSFLSGAFFSQASFPTFLTVIADIFPLKYFIDLVAAISLDGEQIWERPVDVAVIAAWGAAGTVLALRRFRWVPREG